MSKAGKGKLSANQLAVLELACTHGHVMQGCVQQSEYGARTRTLHSLRKRGLSDFLHRPTTAGYVALMLINPKEK